MKQAYRKRRAMGLVSALCIAWLICSFFGAPAVLAQNTNAGEIRGTVTDASGAVVPGAEVTILNVDTGVKTVIYTNNAGLYDAVSLLPGRYSLTFRKEGFNRFVRDGIVLHVEILTVDAQLSVGAATQQVEVHAEVPPLQTESGEQGVIFRSDTLRELPNVGYDWIGFVALVPGVTGSGTGVSVNGTQRYQQNMLSNGGEITLVNSQNFITGMFESLSELKVSTATFSAEYSQGTAVINQISKSGTNQFHGAAYEFAQNTFFNARSFFATTVPIRNTHRYGAALGGPVKKDKLFFYFNYEGLANVSSTPAFYTFPTAAMKAGDFSNPVFRTVYDPTSISNIDGKLVRQPFPGNRIPASQLDPVALNIQKYFPATNLPGVYNNLQTQYSRSMPGHNYFGRLDYNISNGNRLTGTVREQGAPPILLPTPTYPMDSYTSYGYVVQGQVTDVSTFSPTVVNEARVAYVRQYGLWEPPSFGKGYPQKLGINYAIADLFPNVSIGGPVGATSIGGGVYAKLGQGTTNLSDVVTMMRGRHILKFGGQLAISQNNTDGWAAINAASFSFSGIFTARVPFDTTSGLGYADFLTGQSASWSASITPIVGMRNKVPQFFIQDAFKVRPNLTLNLGVRYQIQPGWYEVAGRVASFDPSIINPATNTPGAMWWQGDNGRKRNQATVADIFLPRLGFAWTPSSNSKWAVHGGFGVFDHMWGGLYGTSGLALGYKILGSSYNTDGVTPVLKISNPNPSLPLILPSPDTRKPQSLNGQYVTQIIYHAPVARIYEWSLSIQRVLSRDMVGEVAYIGNSGYNLSYPRDANQVPQSLLGPGNAQTRRPYPQFQNISTDFFDGFSNYHALQASLRKRFARGFSFDLNYTWSKNLVTEDAAGWGGQAGPQNWQNAYAPDSNYGLSNNHRAQVLKGDVIYQLPVGKGKALVNRGGLLDAMVGGWQCSAIFMAQSGAPFTPTIGLANLSGSLAGSWYPDRIANGGLADPTIGRWFDTSAFVQPAPFTFGNSGRNILIGPGMLSLDASMSKNFAIRMLGEGGRLQLRIDATNALNHPIFNNPNALIGTPGAGIISSTINAGRTVQLGARLSF